ncbi:hypothetical protein GCM10009813_36990 [Brevibacterium marinum]
MLWTLYWRGDARMRERVEDLIDPAQVTVTAPAPPSPKEVRRDVKEFAALARAGAYLARDRRVSPKERTRWRFTYKDHFTQSFAALTAGSGEEIRPAVEAVSTLITLACETEGFDYFRSEDPIEASKVVISEKVDQLWTGIGRALGPEELCRLAAVQIVHWERRFGWTRVGFGRTSEKESTLTEVLPHHLLTPDMWSSFTEHYVQELAEVGDKNSASYGTVSARTDALEPLNKSLIDRLNESGEDDRIDALLDNRGLTANGRKRLRGYQRALNPK